jgi:hypothetical protein
MSDDDDTEPDGGIVNLSEFRKRTEEERRRRRKASDSSGATGEGPPKKIVNPRGILDVMRVLKQVDYTLARDTEGVAMILPGQDPNRFWHCVDSEEFAEYLSVLYGAQTSVLTPTGRLRGVTTRRCIEEVQRTLRAESRNGPVLPFARRYIQVGETKYIDWGWPDDARMMVITARGWRLDTAYTVQRPRPDIPLVRTVDMLPLPKPLENRAKADEALRLFEQRSGLSPDGFRLLMLALGHAWSDGPGPIISLTGPPERTKRRWRASFSGWLIRRGMAQCICLPRPTI